MTNEIAHIVIVGHLDHGKSTLIGRLLLDTHSLANGKLRQIREAARELSKKTELAFLVDQLKEERRQGRSIETTQVSFRTTKRNYVLIDAPGHKELIPAMLTGASLAEAAVLIIDVHQGIKEQTQRHAYLIKLLGIQRVIIALNKMDLIQYKKEKLKVIMNELKKLLQDLQITPFLIIPVSAKKGGNITQPSQRMNWYKGPSLLQALDRLPLDKKTQKKPFRFCVQDIYKGGRRNIVAGKIISGIIQNGQRVMVLPSLKKTKVSLIKIYGVNRKEAFAGENIGLCLQDSRGLRRGHILAAQNNYPEPRDSFKSTVFWIAKEPLRINQTFLLRLATQEVDCVAEEIEKPINSIMLKRTIGELKSNQAAGVTLKTKKPLVVENFSFINELGRFVIERKNQLQGVGIVTG